MIASTFAGLYVLVALACPVGMGLMMWFMGRGMIGGKARGRTMGGSGPDEQTLADLKAEQARLAQKIAALEESAGSKSGEPARLARRTGLPEETPEVDQSERTPVKR